MSGDCLSDSGCCLGGYDGQAIDKHPFRLIYIGSFLFSQLPQIFQNAGVSEGCLEGVCKVSGRCLKGVWGTLDTVWGAIMSNQLIEVQLEPF